MVQKWCSTSLNGAPVQIPPFYPKEGLHQIGNVVIRNFELYQLDQSTNSETNPGTAFADLQNLMKAMIRLETSSVWNRVKTIH